MSHPMQTMLNPDIASKLRPTKVKAENTRRLGIVNAE